MVVDARLGRLLRGTAVLGTAASAGAVLARLAERAWRSAEDPIGIEGLVLPDGEDRTVRTDDGAELAVRIVTPESRARGPARLVRRRAPTILLAHCWACSRRTWAPVARRLADDGHRVVLFDHRGHGESTTGSDKPTASRLGDDLAAIVVDLGLRKAVVAGHSMGGFATMAFACDHPDLLRDRVRGLVLVATAAHGVGLGALDPLAGRVLGSGPLGWAMQRPRLGLLMVRGTVGRRPVLTHLAATRDMFLATDAAVRTGCYASFREMDHREGLAKVDVPTVVLVGTRDAITPPRLARAIVDAIPDARLETIEGAGHMLPLEDPDRVADVIAGLATV